MVHVDRTHTCHKKRAQKFRSKKVMHDDKMVYFRSRDELRMLIYYARIRPLTKAERGELMMLSKRVRRLGRKLGRRDTPILMDLPDQNIPS